MNMKKLWSLLTLLMLFSSCSGDDDLLIPKGSSLLGKWDLVKTEGQVPDSEATGEDMPFQEFYIFRADGSFFKQRITDGETLEASGEFELGAPGFIFEGESAVNNLILTYSAENPILSSCYATLLEEHFYLTDDGRLVNTWRACDGLGMEYVRTQ